MTPAPRRGPWVAAQANRPLFVALGISGEEVGEGFASYRVEAVRGGAAPDGTVSNLAVTTAADQALVTAVSTVIEDGREAMNGTAEMTLTYVAKPQGAVIVESRVLHKGRRLAVMTVEALDQSGALVATGRGTYSIRPAPGVSP